MVVRGRSLDCRDLGAVRSDHDGVLEPGESGSVHLVLANSGAVAAEQVTLSASASTTAIQFGAPRPVALLPAFAAVELTIPVTISASLPVGASTTLVLHVAGDQTCDRGGLDVSVPFTVGGARAPEVARIAVTDEADAADRSPVIRLARVTSLRDFDAGVCIAQDRPTASSL